ncbi:MAG: CmcJ/NvfI family oxidoreductase [Geminicoccaceae bacterium]
MASKSSVVSTMQYLAPMDAEPEVYFFEPDPGTTKNDPIPDRHDMHIQDARGFEHDFTMDQHGFEFAKIETEIDPFVEREDVQNTYYPAVAALVRRVVGAAHVHVFDHNYRSHVVNEVDTSSAKPVPWVHNDYTEKSAPQRIRDLLPEDEAERRIEGRYAFINLWRPVAYTVEDSPLGVCAASSLARDDLATLALRYPERDGEIYFVRHNPNHQWYYLSKMRTDEALLLKCFDSDHVDRACFSVHAAFEDPDCPPDARPRQSIEARTIAFFD